MPKLYYLNLFVAITILQCYHLFCNWTQFPYCKCRKTILEGIIKYPRARHVTTMQGQDTSQVIIHLCNLIQATIPPSSRYNWITPQRNSTTLLLFSVVQGYHFQPIQYQVMINIVMLLGLIPKCFIVTYQYACLHIHKARLVKTLLPSKTMLLFNFVKDLVIL